MSQSHTSVKGHSRGSTYKKIKRKNGSVKSVRVKGSWVKTHRREK